MNNNLNEDLAVFSKSPAGQLLAPFGIVPVHQGGGMINYEGARPDRQWVCIIEDAEGSGWGPTEAEDACIECRWPSQSAMEEDPAGAEETAYTSVAAYVEFLKTLKAE